MRRRHRIRRTLILGGIASGELDRILDPVRMTAPGFEAGGSGG